MDSPRSSTLLGTDTRMPHPPLRVLGGSVLGESTAGDQASQSGDNHQASSQLDKIPTRRRRMRRLPVRAIAVLGLATALIGLSVVVWVQRRQSTTNALTAKEVSDLVKKGVDKGLQDAASAPAVSRSVFQAIAPSMVYIDTDEPGAAATAFDSSLGRGGHGVGAGVIINAKGAILTANHVVKNATTITLTFSDGTTSQATITSQEPENDIAVLSSERLPELVVPAVMGGAVQIGDDVYAVGHPLGLANSLSAGVVSGIDRAVPVDEETTLDNLIQFDAAVNPGNSGGPLLNRGGQVVGIVSALANPSSQGFFVGIGFAVPIKSAGGAAGGPQQ
jgi:S1-C subfamily serine protease